MNCENCPLVDPICDLSQAVHRLCELMELFIQICQVGVSEDSEA
jgi:hypothetical protein